jgi:hypothetical protein
MGPKTKMAIFSKTSKSILIKFQQLMETITLNKTAQMAYLGK